MATRCGLAGVAAEAVPTRCCRERAEVLSRAPHIDTPDRPVGHISSDRIRKRAPLLRNPTAHAPASLPSWSKARGPPSVRSATWCDITAGRLAPTDDPARARPTPAPPSRSDWRGGSGGQHAGLPVLLPASPIPPRDWRGERRSL